MTRRKVDPALVERAFALRETGRSIADILDETGFSQGTYYAYVHAHADSGWMEALTIQLMARSETRVSEKGGRA